MLFVLTGSSAAGKTTVLAELAARVEKLEVHDFDEIGVPSGADARWRHRATEAWAQRVLGYQAAGRDSLLTGQSPLGEWLAIPSATQIDGIAACLLDVTDAIRAERLARRPRWLGSVRVRLPNLLGWAAWHRGHARDPRWHPEVIQRDAWDEMRWERWREWQPGDPRWDVLELDTSGAEIGDTVEQLTRWIADTRVRHRAGTLPLSGNWWLPEAQGEPAGASRRC